jgi:para-nitrobenzyl esterase
MGSALEIVTQAGVVAGKMTGDGIRSFLGIPYAAPPVGALRWRPPQPCPAWTAVRDATKWGPDCPQVGDVGTRATQQSEDCLYLNIWSPAGAVPGELPVMVWVHGGSFVAGSGSEERLDGTALAREGVVLVTINYRVGLFGFLAHPGLTQESPDHSSGNYGLLDQVLAFQWIQANIAGFGGDPRRVTAFGVSAGSASLSLLLTSVHGKDLFQQAILQSPGAARRLASLEEAEAAGRQLGEDIEALRQLTAIEVLERTSLLAPKVRGLTTPRVLRPIRDGWVITEDERSVFKKGAIHAMPVIVGTNTDEGSEATASWPIHTVDQYLELLKSSFGRSWEAALGLYPVFGDADVRGRVAELFADTQFNYGARLLAQTAAAAGVPTWRYLFTRRRAHRADGPHHGQEVHYVFGNLDAPYPGELARHDEVDEALSLAIRAAWLAFARTGNPNAPGLAGWPPYEPGLDTVMELGTAVAARAKWRSEQLDFLDGFFEPDANRNDAGAHLARERSP